MEKSQEVEFFERGSQNEDAVWYEINEQAEALFQFTRCASRRFKRKVYKGKRRHRISLHGRASGEEKLHLVHGFGYSSDHEELESDGEYPQVHEDSQDHRSVEHSVVAALESFQQEKKIRMDMSEMSDEIIPLQGGYTEHSAVELLDNLQQNTAVLEDDSDKHGRYKTRRSLLEKKTSSTLGDRSLTNEDPSEPICSTSSTDDDDSEPKFKILAAEAIEKTMADRIQDAIGTSILNDQGMQYAGSKPLGLLIFNFRICKDVDLDVGNCVRVHSPWKEVRTARHLIIILCSYFSQINSGD